ncbi:MAG: amidase family protein, partial [Nanoarchaeota archaeon]
VDDMALILEIISGHDEKDSTSANLKVERYTDYIGNEVKGIKIGLIKESLGEGTNEKVKGHTLDYLSKLESSGINYEEVSLPITMEYGLAVYYLIATSEASTNLAKYCGVRYGKHEELEGNFNGYFSKVRGKNLGIEAKRRIMLGTFARMAGFRDAYYLKATKVRTLIIEEYKKLFKDFDVLLSPTVPILPPRFSEIENLSIMQNYMIDILDVGPNLAGLPHLNVPIGFEKGLPVGVMLIGDHFKEGRLMQVGSLGE